MSSIFEQIKERNRLTRMRLGQDAPEMIALPAHPDIRVAMVPLVEAETQASMIYAASLGLPDNAAGLQATNRAVACHDVWQAIRVPESLDAKVFPSVEVMIEQLEPEEIDILADQLVAFMDYASPTADGITDEMLVVLKKASETIEWNGLSGRRWAILKLYLSVFAPELLAASLSGSGSTDSLTTTSESAESISGASTS